VDDIMLTFYCAAAEADALALLLRGQSGLPVHVREEVVHGHDFADAGVQEQVLGTLRRAAVVMDMPRAKADALIAAVTAARRAHAVRWVMTPVLARGRIA
jgi:hypothetical protein